MGNFLKKLREGNFTQAFGCSFSDAYPHSPLPCIACRSVTLFSKNLIYDEPIGSNQPETGECL